MSTTPESTAEKKTIKVKIRENIMHVCRNNFYVRRQNLKSVRITQTENGFKGSHEILEIFWTEGTLRIQFAEYVYLCARF